MMRRVAQAFQSYDAAVGGDPHLWDLLLWKDFKHQVPEGRERKPKTITNGISKTVSVRRCRRSVTLRMSVAFNFCLPGYFNDHQQTRHPCLR
jgi:hypothetical protein